MEKGKEKEVEYNPFMGLISIALIFFASIGLVMLFMDSDTLVERGTVKNVTCLVLFFVASSFVATIWSFISTVNVLAWKDKKIADLEEQAGGFKYELDVGMDRDRETVEKIGGLAKKEPEVLKRVIAEYQGELRSLRWDRQHATEVVCERTVRTAEKLWWIHKNGIETVKTMTQ